jgi:hypothetical protein
MNMTAIFLFCWDLIQTTTDGQMIFYIVYCWCGACYIEQCVVTIIGALMPQYIVISRNIYCYPVGSLKDCDHLIEFGMPILANSSPNANFESMELVIICYDIFLFSGFRMWIYLRNYTY